MLRYQKNVLGRSQKSKESDAMIPKMINYIRQKGSQRRTYSESANVTTKDWARKMLEHTLDISFQRPLQISLGDKKHVQVICLAVPYKRDRKCSEIGICLVSIFAWSKKTSWSFFSDPTFPVLNIVQKYWQMTLWKTLPWESKTVKLTVPGFQFENPS